MQHYRMISALAVASALAGCSGGTGTLGPGETFAQLAARHAALETSVDNLEAAEGETLYADLPDTAGADTATYTGTIHGTPTGGVDSPPDVEYYADMTMSADFDTNALTGTVTNMKTELSGFTSPEGSASFSGSIQNTTNAAITGTFSGTFQQGANIAEVQTNAFSGSFIGYDPTAASGTHETDFQWQAGGDYSGTSWSDGDWFLEQD